MRDDLQVAMRAGDGDATSETSSLFRIAGTAIAAAAVGHETRQAFPHQGGTWSMRMETSRPSCRWTDRG